MAEQRVDFATQELEQQIEEVRSLVTAYQTREEVARDLTLCILIIFAVCLFSALISGFILGYIISIVILLIAAPFAFLWPFNLASKRASQKRLEGLMAELDLQPKEPSRQEKIELMLTNDLQNRVVNFLTAIFDFLQSDDVEELPKLWACDEKRLVILWQFSNQSGACLDLAGCKRIFREPDSLTVTTTNWLSDTSKSSVSRSFESNHLADPDLDWLFFYHTMNLDPDELVGITAITIRDAFFERYPTARPPVESQPRLTNSQADDMQEHPISVGLSK